MKKRKTSSSRHPLLGRAWQWLTLENSTKALDLLVKFAAVFGALAVANYFVLKPEIEISTRTGATFVIDELHDFYLLERQSEPPRQVLEAAAYSNDENRYLTKAELAYVLYTKLYLASPTISADDSTPSPQPQNPFDPSVAGADELVAFEIYLRYLANPEISESDLDFAITAATASLRARAVVTLSNVGQGRAESVQVSASPTLSLARGPTSSFDLEPGRTVEFAYDSCCMMPGRAEFSSSDFAISYDRPEVVDRASLFSLGSILFLVWLLVVIKEIASWRPGSPMSE